MNPPDFTLDKIKFATDGPTFEKAVALYESGKVTKVEEGIRDRKSTRLNSSHSDRSRMPSSA